MLLPPVVAKSAQDRLVNIALSLISHWHGAAGWSSRLCEKVSSRLGACKFWIKS
jgi:hypothetical protein